MIRYQNDCCGCLLPCVDCGRRKVPHLFCDECGEECELVYRISDDEHICESCFSDRYILKTLEDLLNE